jgi:DNA-binding transcriptional MerR regulator
VTGSGDASLPPKLYYRIGEVAELVGVEPHVLRYWEREFRSIRPTKSAKGQRVYSRRDVENLLRVRELLYRDGFTIAGARKKMQRSGAEPAEAAERPAPCASGDGSKTRAQLVAIRADIEAFLAELGAR